MSKNAHFSSGQDTDAKHMFFGKAYAHNVEGCPKGEDSVYLTPTSNDPYDPFKLICLNEWGKYNHKKLVKLREKQRSDLKKVSGIIEAEDLDVSLLIGTEMALGL